MKKTILAVTFAMTLAAPFAAKALDYTIDPDHSSVTFKVRHLGLSSVKGEFKKFSGDFSYDPKDVAASKTTAVISTGSIDTGTEKRDAHLKSADFLDAGKFSEIKFVSKEIKDPTPESFKIVGELTLNGVTKPTVLDVTEAGVATDPWGNERAAFAATTKINRKDFGITWSKALDSGSLVVGEEVSIDLEIEGIKKKA